MHERVVLLHAALVANVTIGALALNSVYPAHAQYPERLIRAIVPFSTGGTNDITARMIAPHLSKALGQSVVVENRPGAAGNIGIEAVAKSAPDGYTILFSATASTQNPALFRNLRFDPINDIQPVAAIAEYPYASVINNVISLPEVKEQLRKQGGNSEPVSVSDLTQWYRREIQVWKDIVARANIPPVD